MYHYCMKCSVSLASSLVIQLRILLEQTLQTLAFQAACPRYIEYDYCYAEKKSFPETWFQHFPRESSKKSDEQLGSTPISADTLVRNPEVELLKLPGVLKFVD